MQDSSKVPNVLQRALGVMSGRKLRRYTGSDVSSIQRKVADYYNSTSYEAYSSHLGGMNLWPDTSRRRLFIPLCESAGDILDFGCGAGGLAVALAENFPAKRIHAIDIGSNAGALIAQRKAPVQFHRASVLAAPFPDASMDLVISRFVIEHTIYPEKLLSEAWRILRPGGTLYLLYPQLLLKVTLVTALREALMWVVRPGGITYLDPQINETTSDTDDQDAVWLANPVAISRLLRKQGFTIAANVPTESLVAGKK